MKVYDPNAKCSKCGYDVVSTTYFCGRMKRNCGRCNYYWDERPLDQITLSDVSEACKGRAPNRWSP